MSQEYNTENTKVKAFRGCYPVRMKVVVNDCCLDRVRDLGSNVSRGLDRAVKNKLRVNFDLSVEVFKK